MTMMMMMMMIGMMKDEDEDDTENEHVHINKTLLTTGQPTRQTLESRIMVSNPSWCSHSLVFGHLFVFLLQKAKYGIHA